MSRPAKRSETDHPPVGRLTSHLEAAGTRSPEFGAGWHRRPDQVGQGRLAMHGLKPPGGSISLDGLWQFRYWTGDAPDDRFWAVDADRSGFEAVAVPGSWMLQGGPDNRYGIPIYTNVVYPFDSAGYPEIPQPDEGGDYAVVCELPVDVDLLAGDRVILRLGAVESACEVYVNGRRIGCSTDSRLPAEFDITEAIGADDKILVALRVYRWSASTWLEDQDMWWMAGPHRSVQLYRRPAHHIADVHFQTTSLVTRGEATEAVTETLIRLAGPVVGDPIVGDQVLEATLTGSSTGSVVGRVGSSEANGDASYRVGMTVIDPALWSAETPALSTLTVRLLDEEGSELDRVQMTVGIRTVEVGRGQLRVNGEPITIYGVNRHEHDGVTGRWQSDELLMADIALLKASNINAVRTAHYPNDERFYQLCDEHGLYVVDEANVEAHGMVHEDLQPCNDERFADAFVARGARMVARDRNHPSVIAWSLGNEAGFGPNHRAMIEAIRQLDTSRPIAYHPGETDAAIDIVGPMYPTLDELQRLDRLADERPIIMCEYSHAMGNSNGGIEDYWSQINRSARCWGGFIWDWVDQGLARFTDDGERWWAYGGDFGDEPNDRNFNCNGLVDADRRPHPGLAHVSWVYRPVAVEGLSREGSGIAIYNRRTFADLRDLKLAWTVLVDGVAAQAGGVEAPDLGPGQRTTLDLGFTPPTLRPGQEAHLRVTWELIAPTTVLPAGHQVAWDEIALPVGRPRSEAPLERSGAPASVTKREGGGSVLEGGESRVDLDRAGVPRELVLQGRELPVSWGQVGIWRPPTDNDQATFGDEMLVSQLRAAGLDPGRNEATSEGLNPGDVRSSVAVVGSSRIADQLGLAWSQHEVTFNDRLTLLVTWLASPDGDVAFDIEGRADPDLPPLLRIGLELELPGDLSELSWLGPGPHESYSDRKSGLLTGVHQSTVGEQFFPYARPQETGNHTDVRWMALTDTNGQGLVAIGDQWFDFSALATRSVDIERASHPHEVPARAGTVLRLDIAHSGLGTASCGPGLHPGHQVQAYHVRKRIVLRRISTSQEPSEVATRASVLGRPRRWHY